MLKKRLVIVLVVIIMLFTTTTVHAKDFDYALFNQEFHGLLNEERENVGLSPVGFNPILLRLANIRSVEMAEYGNLRYVDKNGVEHAHYRPDGRAWHTVFTDNDVSMNLKGENILMLTISDYSEEQIAEKIYSLWSKSPSHYRNMIHPSFRSSAVGLGVGDGFIISTNLFSCAIPPKVEEKPVKQPVEKPVDEVPITTIPDVPIEKPVEKPIEEVKEPDSYEKYWNLTEEQRSNLLADFILFGYHER